MGELLNALTDEDKAKIRQYITYYAVANEEPDSDDRADIDVILKPWDEAKVDLYNMFGKNFILSKKYTYNESEIALIRSLKSQTDWGTFSSSLRIRLRNEVDNACGIDFFGYFYETDCIYNKLSNSLTFFYKNKKYNFPAGTKYMRFLGKLAELFDMKDAFEAFRLQHSMVLNQATQHGTLNLSIHPLDYMTMSDNNSDWSSCMSWQENGCYRMGTVEMMNSPMVVVAYLTGSETMQFGRYTWNNKKWRQLFVINEHVITPVKPYPYFDDELTKTCLAWLNELSGNQYSEDNYLFGSGENRYLNYYRLAPTANYMYNDFGSCEHLTKIKLPVPDKREGKVIRWSFNYSGKTECMWCGATGTNLTGGFDADSLLCCNCGGGGSYHVCCRCGDRIDEDYDDYFVDEDGDYYCDSCRDEYFTYDDLNEEFIYNEDAIQVYIASDRDDVEHLYNNSDSFWTHYDITSEVERGKRYVHRNEDGEYYIFIDEAPFNVLRYQFGAGRSWNLEGLRSYVDKASYAGYDCPDLSLCYSGWEYDSSYNSARVPIVP